MIVIDRRIWEMKILETLDRRPKKKSDYVLLRSEQVSACNLLLDDIFQLYIPAGRHCSSGSGKIRTHCSHPQRRGYYKEGAWA